MWHLWMEFSEFQLLLLLELQNNGINLDVKSTGIEMKRHKISFMGGQDLLLIDEGEKFESKWGKCKESCCPVESCMEACRWGTWGYAW